MYVASTVSCKAEESNLSFISRFCSLALSPSHFFHSSSQLCTLDISIVRQARKAGRNRSGDDKEEEDVGEEEKGVESGRSKDRASAKGEEEGGGGEGGSSTEESKAAPSSARVDRSGDVRLPLLSTPFDFYL